ncbi:MAG: hypothetical protein ABI443_11605 [Chthoniobacterales bacterium]
MDSIRKHVCLMRIPFAHSALHTLQSLAMQMPGKYSNVKFPFYGGSSHLGMLFLTRTDSPAGTIAGRIQQVSDDAIEASLMNPMPDKDAALKELLTPLLEAYAGQYPSETLTPEYQ